MEFSVSGEQLGATKLHRAKSTLNAKVVAAFCFLDLVSQEHDISSEQSEIIQIGPNSTTKGNLKVILPD